nr:probable disease resistance protein At4g27220 [Ipomoea batatas]GMD44812.1 probable disease resistance protein At4g27220 [Ipomoea batatas]GMD46452.1 probable disease resistance protein At4g27220 [Ipomoea batatas]
MEFVSALLKPVLERIVNPVLEEIGYMFEYKSNIENFRKKVQKIKVMRDGVKERIEEEEKNLQIVAPRVKAWLHETDKITAKEQTILAKKSDVEKGCFKGFCPNLKLRYSLSKKAKKGSQDAVELLGEGYQYSNFSRLGPFLSQRSFVI